VNLLPLDNAILKLKHNGLLTLILTCAASNDLNLVNYVWVALQEMISNCRSFNIVSVRTKKCNCHSERHNRFLTKLSVNVGVALKT